MYIETLIDRIKELDESEFTSFKYKAFDYRQNNLNDKKLRFADFSDQLNRFLGNERKQMSFANLDAYHYALKDLAENKTRIKAKKEEDLQKKQAEEEFEEIKNKKMEEEKKKKFEEIDNEIRNIEFSPETWQRLLFVIASTREVDLPNELVDLTLNSQNKKKLYTIIENVITACAGKDEKETDKRIEWMLIYTSNFLKNNADEDY